jgi:hypothetical protein
MRPITDTDLDIEFGRGKTALGSDNAYAAKISGRALWFSYNGWYIHAGSGYPGYFRDMNSVVGSFSFDPWRSIRFEGYFRDEQRNLQRDTTLYVAPHEQYYHFGISFSNYFSVYYRYTSQVDRLPVPQYDNRENVIQIQTGYNFAAVGFLLYADVGQSENRLINIKSLSQRYMLSTNARLFGTHSYGVTLEYAANQDLFTGEPQKLMSAGFNAVIPIADQTRFMLNVYASKTISLTTQTYQTIDLSFDHTFPWDHRIGIRGRENIYNNSGLRDYAYTLEYVVPVSLPIGRTAKAGELSGRILDSESGAGVPRAIIYVGEATAITDEDGEYRFPVSTPAKYFIQVDKASIGFNRVTTIPMPLEVTIRGGEVTHLNLGVVRSASLKGIISLYGFDSTKITITSPSYIELHPQYDIVVELTNGIETYRRVSDTQGRFSFDEMRPGHWTLTVPEGQLPQYHKLEKEKWEFDFTPGKKDEVTLKILPQRRAIRIIQEGNLIEEKKETKKIRTSRPPQIFQPPQITQQPQITQLPDTSLISYDAALRGYIVQASSWSSNREAIAGVKKAESSTGQPAFVDSVAVPRAGVQFRVYVGPLKTREEAEFIERIILHQK